MDFNINEIFKQNDCRLIVRSTKTEQWIVISTPIKDFIFTPATQEETLIAIELYRTQEIKKAEKAYKARLLAIEDTVETFGSFFKEMTE